MRAVNLIPAESRRRGGLSRPSQSAAYALLGALAVAVAFVTIYVLTTNTISERQAKIASLQNQVAQATAAAASLSKYVAFEQLAQKRIETVRTIAATRFDWHAALSDLSRVVPANTSLQSLFGTVAPGATVSGGGAGGTGALRSAIASPAFELAGCTSTQDDVARLISRLRLINGVTRVSLADSTKQAAGASSGAAIAGATGASSGGCGGNTPSFDLVVFFSPLPGAGPQGVTSAAAPTATGATG